MIRSKDVNAEVAKIEEKIAKGTVGKEDIVKSLCLVVKLLRDVKSNQVKISEGKPLKTEYKSEGKYEEEK